jgi:hypothetical protein
MVLQVLDLVEYIVNAELFCGRIFQAKKKNTAFGKLKSLEKPQVVYKACSKKDRTFAIKTLFYNILSTLSFKVVPSAGDTPSPTFLPLLECFLESTFCDGAQFSYRIFLNLRVFKKRLNFLNSAPTNKVGATATKRT